MRELLKTIESWISEGKQVAIATVVNVYGSAPRQLGAKMAVNQDGLMAGSVSGGCVEGAVVAEATKILKTKEPRLLHYGVTDEQAFSVGLACGGIIEVFVEPLSNEEFDRMKTDLIQDNMFAKITLIGGNGCGEKILAYPDGKHIGQFQSKNVQEEINNRLAPLFDKQINQRFMIKDQNSEIEVFFDIYPPLPRMIIIGAVHIAIPLVTYAKSLGFHTIVVDPRKAFSNRERFPHVDELVQEWPEDYFQRVGLNEGSYVVTVSHDEKLDVPALAIACNSKARYIGALGSKKTFENNKQGIRELGVPEKAIERIFSPIGFKIGAHGAEEIALSIMAEVIAVRNGIN
ncbi:MAG: XdhC family protein [Anaerolineaceae bacterium]